jgi:GAF domain-containing protein
MGDSDDGVASEKLAEELLRENDKLRALYVATYQMHSAFDPGEVLRTLLEILVNFVGAKTFAVYVLDDEPRLLRPVCAEGMALPGAVALGDGIIGRVGATGESHLADVGPAGPEPRICIPLRLADRVAGVVAIWDFLVQKTGLLEVDFELFHLLAAHAASALEAACRAAETGRSPLRYETLAGLLEPAR